MPRNNVFTRIPVDILKQIIAESSSIGQVFRKINLNITGCQYEIFRGTMIDLGVDISNLTHSPGKGFGHPEIPNEQMFLMGARCSTSTMKKRILRDNLKLYRCEKCQNVGEWQGESLVLQLDHIDGNRTNNALTNLRFLCPNCHTQTPTHSQGGKRLAKLKAKTFRSCRCGNPIKGKGDLCQRCGGEKARNTKMTNFGWPDPEVVARLIWERPREKVAQELGCSPNGLKRFCLRNAIDIPPVGYWTRRENGYSHEESLKSQAPIRGKVKRISTEQIEEARRLMEAGSSLRAAAKNIGCHHVSLMHRLKGDPILLLTTHGNAKHIKCLKNGS